MCSEKLGEQLFFDDLTSLELITIGAGYSQKSVHGDKESYTQVDKILNFNLFSLLIL